jgi:hypothetical protein
MVITAGTIQPTRKTAEALRTADSEQVIGELVAAFLARAVADWDDESEFGEFVPTQYSEPIDWRLAVEPEPGPVRVGGRLFDAVEAIGIFCGHAVDVAGRYVAGTATPRIAETHISATLADHPDGWDRQCVLVRVVGTISAELVQP